jgi:exodeoxyribonuclease X
MNDNISKIVVLDTETTDLDPAAGAEVCEIGLVELRRTGDVWDFLTGSWSYVETNAPFSPVARGTHHINPASCLPGAPDCLPHALMIRTMKAMERPGQMLYAAHNAPFDMAFLPELSLAAIDTYQCAKHLWPDCPKFSNQTLRYYLGVEPPADLIAGLDPHRALYDAACTAAVLVRMLALADPTELLRLSTTPILQPICRFGKHEGKPWAEVPIGYLQWMVRANDQYQNDVDLRYTVDYYLNKWASEL